MAGTVSTFSRDTRVMIEPKIVLNGWVTIKTLAAEKGCTTQYISKLINKGTLPYMEYPELNGVKLVPCLALQEALKKENKDL